MEMDYYDYNVVNAGAAPGSYLGMDPAYLVWIPPLDDLEEFEDIKPKQYVDPGSNQESPEEEILIPKIRRKSLNEITIVETSLLEKCDSQEIPQTQKRKKSAEKNIIIKKEDIKIINVPIKVKPSNFDETKTILITKNEALEPSIKETNVSIPIKPTTKIEVSDLPAKTIVGTKDELLNLPAKAYKKEEISNSSTKSVTKIESPAKVHTSCEKETEVEKSPSFDNLDDIKFADDCDEEVDVCNKNSYQDSNIMISNDS